MTEHVIPTEKIEEIARGSVATDLEAIKAEMAKAVEQAASFEEKLKAVDKFMEEARRVQEGDVSDSKHAGLHFDPTDAEDPVVKHFGLLANDDIMTSVPYATDMAKNMHGTPGGAIRAKGLGLRTGVYLRAVMQAHSTGNTIEHHLKDNDCGWMIPQIETWVERESGRSGRQDNPRTMVTREKALGTIVASGGATLVPQEFSSEFIQLLRNSIVVLNAGPSQLVLPPGGVEMSRLTGASTASYKGEPDAALASQPTFGEFVMKPTDLYGIVPVADRLFGVARVEGLLRDEMIRTMSIRADLALLRGSGDNNTVRGIRSWATDGSTPDRVFSSASADATPTTDEVIADLRELGSRMAQSNVMGSNKALFMNPRTEWYLRTYVEGAGGNRLFAEEMDRGQLMGARYYSSNQIPTSLGAGTATELMLADMSEMVHGVEEDMEVGVFPAAAYVDSNSNVQSGLARGETVLRTRMAHDFRPRHNEAITVCDSVLY